MNVGDQQLYSRSVFEAILAGLATSDPFRDKYELDDRGAWVVKDYRNSGLGWHPLCEVVDQHDSLNPLDEPWLPFPFTARRLAALLADGCGYFIQGQYGGWDDGPDEFELGSIGKLGGKAKQAIKAAYQEFRDAVALAPKLDRSLATAAADLAQQYREERETAIKREGLWEQGIADVEYTKRVGRVQVAVVDVGQLLSVAQKTADDAYSRWRRAVVQHLLLPVDRVDSEAFENKILQAIPPERRAEAIAQIRAGREFSDSEMGRAHWALVCERGDTERELRRWQLMAADTPTDALIQEQKVAELKSKLASLDKQLSDMDEANQVIQPAAETQPDWALLATRDALCRAFGAYGLKKVWFDDLNSRKWLRDSRKVIGQGQRSQAVEPLFCPFQVMNGLVNASRKSWLNETTGWRLLELHFSQVYQANAVADPREPTG